MKPVFSDRPACGPGERCSPGRRRAGAAPRGSARRLRTIAAFAACACLAVTAPDGAAAAVHLGFDQAAITVSPGDTFTVSLAILQADSPFNAFDASVRFDPVRLAFVASTPLSSQIGAVISGACANTFHRFEPAADSLKISLSMLCGGVNATGPGPVYRVRFRALSTPGTTTLAFGPFTEFYRAGLFVRPVLATGLTVTVQGNTGVGAGPGPLSRLEFAPPAPNHARAGGGVLLEFALPVADFVDVDLLDAQGRRVATRGAEWFEAGRHRLAWHARPLASGGYFLRVQGRSSGSAVRRWIVLR